MERRGGKQVIDRLTKLKTDLQDFFGARNEFAAGARAFKDIPEKPSELVVYELLQTTKLPLVAGGLLDQPHIWLLQLEVVDGEVRSFDRLREAEEERARNDQLKLLMNPKR